MECCCRVVLDLFTWSLSHSLIALDENMIIWVQSVMHAFPQTDSKNPEVCLLLIEASCRDTPAHTVSKDELKKKMIVLIITLKGAIQDSLNLLTALRTVSSMYILSCGQGVIM